MVREHGGDMLDAKSMGEDLKSFCEQDDFCRPGRAAGQEIQSLLLFDCHGHPPSAIYNPPDSSHKCGVHVRTLRQMLWWKARVWNEVF